MDVYEAQYTYSLYSDIISCSTTYFSGFVLANNEESRIVFAEKLHLREGPGLSFHIIDTLEKNKRLKVLDRQGDWLYVEVNEKKGWVASWLTQSEQINNAKKYAIAQVDHLNIRLEPSLSLLYSVSYILESKWWY